MGKVIKSGKKPGEAKSTTAVSSGKVIDREVAQAHQTAARILADAQKEAEALISKARVEAEAIRAEAREGGYREGLAEWEARLAEMRAALDQALRDATPQIAHLAVRIAEKILRKHLDTDPESIVPMVQEALATTRGYRGGFFIIRVHPDDVAALEGARERLLQLNPSWEALQIVGDDRMARGGCRIESDFGTIDASLETQLKAIEYLLTGGQG